MVEGARQHLGEKLDQHPVGAEVDGAILPIGPDRASDHADAGQAVGTGEAANVMSGGENVFDTILMVSQRSDFGDRTTDFPQRDGTQILEPGCRLQQNPLAEQ